MLGDLIIRKRDEILRIVAHHGVRSVRVFGSWARGDPRPDSDVDFLIEAGPRTSPWFPGGLVADLEALLGRRVDVVEACALNPKLRGPILDEAIPL